MSQLRARGILQVGAWLTAASVLVGGCTSSQDETTEAATGTTATSAEETTAEETTADAATFTVAFDGERCSYDGPSELPPGEVTIMLVNDSTRTTFAEMAKLQDGVNFDDVVAYHSPEPFEGTRPKGELYEPLTIDQVQAWAGDTGSISGSLETGEYILACLQRGSANALVWIAQPGGVSVAE